MMATVDSEQRLAKTLLHLGEILGKKVDSGLCIENRMSHEELSRMVGTTRPWIGRLLKKFRERGLIGLTQERYLTLNEKRLKDFVA